MPRKRNSSEMEPVSLRVSAQLAELLDRLVARGVLGTSRPEVLKYLLVREVERIFPEEVKGPTKERSGVDEPRPKPV